MNTNKKNREIADKRGTRIVNQDLTYDFEGNIIAFPIDGERWHPTIGNSQYAVSDLGRVMRIERGKASWPGAIVKGCKNHDGYIRVKLGKSRHPFVHVLVAEAFIGPCPEGKECNHKDRNKQNNRSSNLEYLTHKGNMLHAINNGGLHLLTNSHRKLTNQEAIRVRSLYKSGVKATEISKIINVPLDVSSYCRIGRGQIYRDVAQ